MGLLVFEFFVLFVLFVLFLFYSSGDGVDGGLSPPQQRRLLIFWF